MAACAQAPLLSTLFAALRQVSDLEGEDREERRAVPWRVGKCRFDEVSPGVWRGPVKLGQDQSVPSGCLGKGGCLGKSGCLGKGRVLGADCLRVCHACTAVQAVPLACVSASPCKRGWPCPPALTGKQAGSAKPQWPRLAC